MELDLVELPFDQYQRYRLVADLLTGTASGAPETVIEIGGGVESRLAAFLPQARIVIADVQVGRPGPNVTYLRADARGRLPFRDGAFAAAVTVDTLEHVPRGTRATLVRELRRVAAGPVVIACPVAAPETVAAELAIAACYRAVFARDHPWLAEHLSNGLPAPDEIEGPLTDAGGAWQRFHNGYLPEWQALMLLHLLFDEMPGGPLGVPALRALNVIYNERLYSFANRPPAYRMAWVHVPRPEDLPSVAVTRDDDAPAADRAAFEAAFRVALSFLPADRERLLAELERLRHRLAATLADREKVVEDRSRVERLRHESRVECNALLMDRDRLQAEAHALRQEHARILAEYDRLTANRDAWIVEVEYLQRQGAALTDAWRRLRADYDALSAQVGDLRWRLGRLWPFDRMADLVAPVVRPLMVPIKRRRLRRQPPAEPYGTDTQARLTGSYNGAGPSRAPVTVVICAGEGPAADTLARTRKSLADQTAAPIEVREGDATVADDVRGTHVAFLLAGDRLAPNALAEVARVLAQHPDATVVYSDEDEWAPDGRRENPQLKPGWDPELARSASYLGAFACFRRDLLGLVPGGLSVAELRYGLTLAAVERDEALARHVPRVLCHVDPANRARERLVPDAAAARSLLAAHLRRCGEQGEAVPAGPGFRVRRPVDPATSASIIIPYRDAPDLTERCIAALVTHNRHPSWELVLVDNGSVDPRAEAVVQRAIAAHPGRVQLIRYPRPFNFSAMNNVAAEQARGDVLVLVNNDTEVQTDGWLEHLISLADRPGIGAVGTLLLFPDGTIQHCGIVLGMGSWPGRPQGVAGLVLRGCSTDEVDPLLYAYDRRAGAVTAAFVAVRRDRYLAVGGLDETLRNDFNDVDLCLKLEARGLRTLYTPHVCVTHHESVTRSSRAVDAREVDLMFQRWSDRLATDPHVSPHLDRTTLKPALALRPVQLA